MKQHVEGYNKRTKGDGPYLPGAFFDPDEKFANAGDPEAAGKVEAAKQPSSEPTEEEKERAKQDAGRSENVPTGQSVTPEPSNGASIYKDNENPSEAPYVDPLPPEITPAPEPEDPKTSGIKITKAE